MVKLIPSYPYNLLVKPLLLTINTLDTAVNVHNL